MALRSRFPRKLITLAQTEAGVDAYAWPADFMQVAALSVGGSETWEPSDPETVRSYERGGASLLGGGVWMDVPGEDGLRKLRLYPPPGDAHGIELEYVYQPAEFTQDSDEPAWMPRAFHKGLLYIAATVYFEDVEDNPELAKWNQEKGDLVIAELVHYDNERKTGQGVFMPGIVGWTR